MEAHLVGRDGSPTNLVTRADPTSKAVATVKVAIPKAQCIVAKQSTIGGRLSPTRSYSTEIKQQPINNSTESQDKANPSRSPVPFRRNGDRTTEISQTSVRIKGRRFALPAVSSSAKMRLSRHVIQPSSRSGRRKRRTALTSS